MVSRAALASQHVSHSNAMASRIIVECNINRPVITKAPIAAPSFNQILILLL